MQQLKDIYVISVIDIIEDDALIEPIKGRLGVEALEVVIMNFGSDSVNVYDEMVSYQDPTSQVMMGHTITHQ